MALTTSISKFTIFFTLGGRDRPPLQVDPALVPVAEREADHASDHGLLLRAGSRELRLPRQLSTLALRYINICVYMRL